MEKQLRKQLKEYYQLSGNGKFWLSTTTEKYWKKFLFTKSLLKDLENQK